MFFKWSIGLQFLGASGYFRILVHVCLYSNIFYLFNFEVVYIEKTEQQRHKYKTNKKSWEINIQHRMGDALF